MRQLLIAFIAIFLLSSCGQGKKNFGNDDFENDYFDSANIEFLDEDINNRVFFSLNSSELNNDSKEILLRQAEWIKSHSDVNLLIEGHCDIRGTVEYNIGLGERRADMVKRFFVANGVDSSRLEVISYGKERPAAVGEGEEVHRQNRRSVTVVRR